MNNEVSPNSKVSAECYERQQKEQEKLSALKDHTSPMRKHENNVGYLNFYAKL